MHLRSLEIFLRPRWFLISFLADLGGLVLSLLMIRKLWKKPLKQCMEWSWMDEELLLIRLNLTKVLVEIMTMIAAVIVVATVIVAVILGVDLVVETASIVANLGILLGSVLVKVEEGASMVVVVVVEMIGMVEMVVAVVMVLTEMVIDLVVAIEMLVVGEVQELTVLVVIAQDHMNVGAPEEVFVSCSAKTAEELLVLLGSLSRLHRSWSFLLQDVFL